ncbi:DUF1345 domain-containing protein [Duganella sp. LX20W]|uniref:DUF1345 domain-containing protein n=1 Tax=Rugamonas brunnea TaxID=2758569 RepID=A0A7W2IB89_9BURK|nr:DUF1345 domain-containing protein [Rugamonas brunnea]MBA5636943.1 DUF1345 domain-containing protein [Rugamonas brunnea]
MTRRLRLPLRGFVRSRPHLIGAIALGAVVAPFLPDAWSWLTRLLVAWNAGTWGYLVTMAWMMMRADHAVVKRIAARQDERSPVILSTLCVAALASLAAIVSQLSTLKDVAADERAWHYGLAVLTLLGSWFLVGTLFTFHYAHLYYTEPGAPPLAFPDGEQQPDYWDFLYFSFTIAVAAQTSDVTVRAPLMRKLVLGQSVLSFFFNLVILGLSINIAAGIINT